MIVERAIRPILHDLFKQYPVVTVTGPRQAGKTTLCRACFPELPYVNLEAPDVRDSVRGDPRGFLRRHADGAVLDEIQRVPELLSYIQPVVDERRENGLFVLTGSQHFGLTEALTQSLAGRTGILRLLPFSIAEVRSLAPDITVRDLMYTGFYPRIHDQSLDPTQALGDYLETYVERDVRQITELRSLPEFQRFIRLCAGRIGQLVNFQSLANDTGVSHTTARAWIGVLEASYIVFRLTPFFANVSKRLLKSPKLYFYDVGLASYLLGIESPTQIETHPLRGSLFENLVITEAVKHRFNQGKRSNLHFYRERGGNEVDLIYTVADRLAAIEIKAGETVNRDFFRGLSHIRKTLGEQVAARILVYGGDDESERSGIRVTTAPRLASALRTFDRAQ